MSQGFAVATTEVCESRCIAVVWLRPNVNLFGLGHAFAVIEAGICARHRITIYDRRRGDRLSAAEQGFEGHGRSYGRDGRSTFDKVSSADFHCPGRRAGQFFIFLTHIVISISFRLLRLHKCGGGNSGK